MKRTKGDKREIESTWSIFARTKGDSSCYIELEEAHCERETNIKGNNWSTGSPLTNLMHQRVRSIQQENKERKS